MQQPITWTSVDQDLQRHMVTLGPNVLNKLLILGFDDTEKVK